MTISISSNMYSGCYGGETTNIADLIVTTVQCSPSLPSLVNKQVIFVVDESGSMNDSMNFVKTSLFSFRNSLLRLLGHDITEFSESDRDKLFILNCRSSLITFSDKAKVRWDSQDSGDFSGSVNNLRGYNRTNLGDALTLAFQNKIPDYATWIILLTDGLPNKGSCQSLDSFVKLNNNRPENTIVVPLGYTTDFDAELLSKLGTMTYIDSHETMVEAFGCIAGEIVSCFGIGSIEYPDLGNSHQRDVFGSKNIGLLCNDKTIRYGFLPFGNTKREEFSKFKSARCILTYYNIKSASSVGLLFTVNQPEEPIPVEVFESYFAASKARILLQVYKSKWNESADKIKKKLEDWKHPAALEHKEEILRILDKKLNKHNRYSLITRSLSEAQQSGYLISGHTTPTQKNACKMAIYEASQYS